MTNQKAVAEKLLQIKAIQFNANSPYTWASGWKSPIYCDNRKVLSYPYIRDFIKSEMCNLVFEDFPDAELVAGVATAGIPWGAMVADQLKLPFVYVRPKPKEHGLGNQIEGHFEPLQKAVIIEDLISTGKSSLQVVELLKNRGVEVIGMVAIFSYGFEVANKAVEHAGIHYKSLTSYDDIIELLIEKGEVNAEQQSILLNWRENPSQWTGV